jgi:GTP1/Obg family GTP-binding protein
VTLKVKKKNIFLEGIPIQIIDTPGLLDGKSALTDWIA